ncbi:MAG: endolytic transglycosylase MltG, partial [Candidatus Hydrogenedentota bacterium]
ARAAHERPKVASVIENRLERGMTLDMDTTLQYALGKYGERMLNEDKEVDSPYNTYRNRGLPPGPIANPGLASFRAALDPADTEYLYFVSNGDGRTHTFSRTLEEHNQAVYRYRQEMASQRRALQESSNGDDTP